MYVLCGLTLHASNIWTMNIYVKKERNKKVSYFSVTSYASIIWIKVARGNLLLGKEAWLHLAPFVGKFLFETICRMTW